LNDALEISAAINKNELSANVHLLGYISESEAAYLYKNAFSYVLPSKNEGFGLPLLEAFSYGLPVICSNCGSLPEIAAEAAYSVSVLEEGGTENLATALCDFITNESLRNDYAQKGIERNKAFSWLQTASQINEHIKNI
jgi:glycosyltransferase involved in cell wall biosynthesis